MATLPFELLFMIVDLLDREDLKTARLVCLSFEQRVTKRLFHEVHLLPFEDSIKGLQKIASHTRLCRYVKHFTYHYVSLDEVSTFSDYQQRVTESCCDPHILPSNLLPYYETYRSCARGHHKCKEIQTLRDRLPLLFRKLSNITTLELVRDVTQNLPWSNEGDLKKLDLYRRGYLYPLKPGYHDIGAHFAVAVQAAHLAGLRILNLRGNDWINPFTTDNDKTILGNLQRLSYQHGDSHINLGYVALRPLVPMASNITHLNLNFGSNKMIRLSVLYEKPTLWRNLTHLSLNGFCEPENNLVTFLRWHRRTLTHLDLANILLMYETAKDRPSSWRSVLTRFRRDLNLKEFSLDGTLSKGGAIDYDENQVEIWAVVDSSASTSTNQTKQLVKDFVLRKGSNPFLVSTSNGNGDKDEWASYQEDLARSKKTSWTWGRSAFKAGARVIT